MTVNKNNLYKYNSDYTDNQRGASILEVLLSMAIIAILSPFIYSQITETAREIQDVSYAKKIINTRGNVLNFVRLNQDKWPDTAQIQLNPQELEQITNLAKSGFVDKYVINGIAITDIYLSFNFKNDALRSKKIAKKIGTDATTPNKDGIAYGDYWAVSAPDFKPSDIIYRISHDFNSDDNSKYLHRGTAGEEELNTMYRSLNMGKFNIYSIGTVTAKSGKILNTNAALTEIKDISALNVYFVNGANMDGNNVHIGTVRVGGDVTGFRTINAKKLNDSTYSVNGNIISDKAKITNSVNVGKNLTLKSDSEKTISGFTAITTHSITVPYLSTDELDFHNNFGLTVSGELLMSTVAPIKIGSWTFPSATPPSFSSLTLSRATMPTTPKSSDFNKLVKSDWKN